MDMITVDNQTLNRIAKISSPSQAQYPLEALRVPLYQAPSTPGCDRSSVSSSMVSLSVDDDDGDLLVSWQWIVVNKQLFTDD